MTYVDMDWDWLVRNAKVHDRKTDWDLLSLWRLRCLRAGMRASGEKASVVLEVLERAGLRAKILLSRLDDQAERAWLREHRSPQQPTGIS